MYKCAKKLMGLAFLVVSPLLLSACGGAPTEDNTLSQPSSTANKPEASSQAVASSIAASSVPSTPPQPSSSSAVASTGQSKSSSSQDTSTKLDTIPPETPRLELFRLSKNSITLIWDDALDNVAISHYKLERNGEYVATVEYPSHILYDQNLVANTDYSYTITAFDLDGNNSEASPVFSVRTLANPGAASSMPGTSSQSSNSSQSKSSSNSSSKSLIPSSSSSSRSSSNSSSNSITKSSSSSSSFALQSITITWSHPDQRENGSFLELDEIGGYEIRYRKPTDSRYTYITLSGNRTNEYIFTGNIPGIEFEIAVFDNRGLYSRFVKVGQ